MVLATGEHGSGCKSGQYGERGKSRGQGHGGGDTCDQQWPAGIAEFAAEFCGPHRLTDAVLGRRRG